MNSIKFAARLFSVVMAVCLALGIANAAEFNVAKCHSVCQKEIKDSCIGKFSSTKCYKPHIVCIKDCNSISYNINVSSFDVAGCRSVCQKEIKDSCIDKFKCIKCYEYYNICLNDCNEIGYNNTNIQSRCETDGTCE